MNNKRNNSLNNHFLRKSLNDKNPKVQLGASHKYELTQNVVVVMSIEIAV